MSLATVYVLGLVTPFVAWAAWELATMLREARYEDHPRLCTWCSKPIDWSGRRHTRYGQPTCWTCRRSECEWCGGGPAVYQETNGRRVCIDCFAPERVEADDKTAI